MCYKYIRYKNCRTTFLNLVTLRQSLTVYFYQNLNTFHFKNIKKKLLHKLYFKFSQNFTYTATNAYFAQETMIT